MAKKQPKKDVAPKKEVKAEVKSAAPKAAATNAKAKKEKKSRKPLPKAVRAPFMPFAAFGRYVKGSWQELRQVRWPNRKATWALTLAVLLFTAFFVVIIVALDAAFQQLFEGILL